MPTCTACQADNAERAKFCSSCGSPLLRRCPSCGNPADGRFCSECGAALSDQAPRIATPADPVDPAPTGPSGAERRITSVLFADLVGFTALSESRDPDDVRELLSRYFAVGRTVISRYGGVVEKFIGDAVMAVWGVPVAHEDDAERAVRAGFDLVDAVRALGEEVGAPGLAMRVGVVTGDVAVNIGVVGEGMVAGDTVNTASRVQSLADPGRIWVDEQTRQLTAAAISYDDEGEHELKGKSEPLQLFSARQIIAAVGGARRVDGLEAPFCGRDHELRLVKELFHATLDEHRPRLVAVFGAPGIGKSRLGWEFDKYYDGINTTVMGHRGRCLSYGDGVSFWALAEMVQGRLAILEGDGTDVVVARLREGLERYVADDADRGWLLPRLATLLGVAEVVAPSTSYAKDDLFAAWRTFFEHVARSDDSAGVVIRIDDLQWADPGLLEFIDYVVNSAQAPIFVLTLARTDLTERAPAFGTGRRATSVHLEPLTPAAMGSLVDGLVDGLPDQLRDSLVARAEGVPLFAVETVRALIDRDAVIPRDGRYVLAPDALTRVDLADESLPTTLQTLIASRLDGLTNAERRAVQDAAVLGQSFTRDGLAALAAAVGDDLDVDETLASLVRKEIFSIESDPRSPERGQHRFVQAMVRTVAFETLSRRDRKARHLAAAEHLSNEPDADAIPAVIASHYLDAHAASGTDSDRNELAARAIELLQRAAERATGLGAPGEARRHLQTALTLVADPLEVASLSEAAARAAVSSGETTEAVELSERARRIYLDAGRQLDAARALAVWAEAQINAGLGHEVIEPVSAVFEQLVERPDATALSGRLALAVARGYYLSKGEPTAAIPWFDRAVRLGEAVEDLPMLAATLASYAGALVLTGRGRMGLGLLRVSLELAREVDDPSMQLRPLNNLVSFLATRDAPAACGYATEGLAIGRRLGDRVWMGFIASSAAHVFWNSGRWDDVLMVAGDIDDGGEINPTVALLGGYRSCVQAARGQVVELPKMPNVPSGQHVDVLGESIQLFLSATELRRSGDQRGAAAASQRALDRFREASGQDDDFPLFWVTAVDDAIGVGHLAAAAADVALVTEAAVGHVPALTRALLPWLRARVSALAGDDESAARDFVAADRALREFGAPFYRARALLDQAEWLQSRHRVAEALPLLDEARAVFASLDAQPWLLRAGGAAEAVTPVAPAGTR